MDEWHGELQAALGLTVEGIANVDIGRFPQSSVFPTVWAVDRIIDWIVSWTPGEVTGIVLGVLGIVATWRMAVRVQRLQLEAAREARKDQEHRDWRTRMAPSIQEARNLIFNLLPMSLPRLVRCTSDEIRADMEATDERWRRIRDELGQVSIAHPSKAVRDAADSVRTELSRYLSTWQLTLQMAAENGPVDIQAETTQLDAMQAQVREALGLLIDRLHLNEEE